MHTNQDDEFMQLAIKLSSQGMDSDTGGPFGAVITKEGQIIATGINKVVSTGDPTAHAEIIAIQNACKALGTYNLDGCVLYTSCEPCPMCLGAIYWAHIGTVYYANTREDAANIDFDDSYIYEELSKPMAERKTTFVQLGQAEALQVFHDWKEKLDKVVY